LYKIIYLAPALLDRQMIFVAIQINKKKIRFEIRQIAVGLERPAVNFAQIDPLFVKNLQNSYQRTGLVESCRQTKYKNLVFFGSKNKFLICKTKSPPARRDFKI